MSTVYASIWKLYSLWAVNQSVMVEFVCRKYINFMYSVISMGYKNCQIQYAVVFLIFFPSLFVCQFFFYSVLFYITFVSIWYRMKLWNLTYAKNFKIFLNATWAHFARIKLRLFTLLKHGFELCVSVLVVFL